MRLLPWGAAVRKFVRSFVRVFAGLNPAIDPEIASVRRIPPRGSRVGLPAGGSPVGGSPVGGLPVGGSPVGGLPVGGLPGATIDPTRWRRRAAVGGIGLLLVLAVTPTWSVEPSERLADPALEARARAIGSELRCLVCQNESIDESGADLARDIRTLVRRRLTLGDSDASAIQAVVDRYGEFVLLRPPVERATWLLWFGPAALLLIGIVAAAVWLRRPSRVPDISPLTEDERRRLVALDQRDGG